MHKENYTKKGPRNSKNAIITVRFSLILDFYNFHWPKSLKNG